MYRLLKCTLRCAWHSGQWWFRKMKLAIKWRLVHGLIYRSSTLNILIIMCFGCDIDNLLNHKDILCRGRRIIKIGGLTTICCFCDEKWFVKVACWWLRCYKQQSISSIRGHSWVRWSSLKILQGKLFLFFFSLAPLLVFSWAYDAPCSSLDDLEFLFFFLPHGCWGFIANVDWTKLISEVGTRAWGVCVKGLLVEALEDMLI